MPSGGPRAAPTVHRSRLTERHVLALGLAMSGIFVLLAIGAAALAAIGSGSTWTALHLAMAGAATVAIGTFMPHFAVTLSGTRPAPSPIRLATLLLLAAGSAVVVAGVTFGLGAGVIGIGTALVVIGLVGVGVHTFSPMRNPLARRHHVVSATYGLALAELAAGVIVGGLGAAGVGAVVSNWALVRPVHAWLTLFGAISLTILATLVYLAPTVMGARIRAGWELMLAVVGIAGGPLVVICGFLFDARAVVIAGAALTAAGAIGQIGYVVDAWRRRGPYTSEHDWRSVAVVHLMAGPAWFAAAAVVALIGFVSDGRLAGWSIGLLALPMTAGWMLQELVGSWTHLAPSVTPGGPELHARQRRVMAVAARTRLVTWNVTLVVLWVALSLGAQPVAMLAGLTLAATILFSVSILGRALALR